ncbi:MAG: hypothetical protein P9L97_03515 [Candidatus Tenebribacter davisii]|nr:hypothetical protein [Candidatus Tenebribacter davisii]
MINPTTNNVHNKKIFEFLELNEKKIIVKLKYKKKKLDLWMTRYLEVFPQFSVRLLGSNNHPELPCDYWVNDLLNNVDEHCKHCKEFNNERDLSNSKTPCSVCLQKYKSFIQNFCDNCVQKDKNLNCTKEVLDLFEKTLKKDSNRHLDLKASMSFSVFCHFDPDELKNRKYFNFNLFNITLKFPEGNTTGKIIFQKNAFFKELKDFISGWIALPEDMSKRKVYEIAFKIIVLHYLLLYDVLNKTIFYNSPEYEEGTFIDHDNESSNVIAAYVLKRNNYEPAGINKILENNVNEDQIINLRFNDPKRYIELDKEQILLLINKIKLIYNYPVLENVTLSKLPKKYKNFINKLNNAGKISSTKVKFTDKSAYRNEQIDLKYLEYIILVKLVSLLESIKRTRFTNKLPDIFKKDNLIKLRDEMISDDFEEDSITMVQACKNLDFKYKATNMAIHEKLKYHPKYEEFKNLEDREFTNYKYYNKIHWFFYECKGDYLEEWIDNVRKLKK